MRYGVPRPSEEYSAFERVITVVKECSLCNSTLDYNTGTLGYGKMSIRCWFSLSGQPVHPFPISTNFPSILHIHLLSTTRAMVLYPHKKSRIKIEDYRGLVIHLCCFFEQPFLCKAIVVVNEQSKTRSLCAASVLVPLISKSNGLISNWCLIRMCVCVCVSQREKKGKGEKER